MNKLASFPLWCKTIQEYLRWCVQAAMGPTTVPDCILVNPAGQFVHPFNEFLSYQKLKAFYTLHSIFTCILRRTSNSNMQLCRCTVQCSFHGARESHQEIPHSAPCFGTPRCTDPGPGDRRSHRPPCWGPVGAAMSRMRHPTGNQCCLPWTCENFLVPQVGR